MAESLVVTEFYCLFQGERGIWQDLNKIIGMAVGIYFAAIVIYLAINVFPILIFPTQDAMSDNFENFGMIETLKNFLDDKKIQLFCVDTIDIET